MNDEFEDKEIFYKINYEHKKINEKIFIKEKEEYLPAEVFYQRNGSLLEFAKYNFAIKDYEKAKKYCLYTLGLGKNKTIFRILGDIWFELKMN
jgi:hypothetical protein